MKFLLKHQKSIWSLAVLFFLYVAVFLNTISPFVYVIADNHWLGSEAGYSYWFLKNFQWGKDIVQNIGPLGFLHFPLSYTGMNDHAKMIGNFILSGLLSGLVVYLFFKIKHKFVGLIFIVIFTSLQISKISIWFTSQTEADHYFITVCSLYVLFTTKKLPIAVIISSALAVMALGKGMFLFSNMLIIFAAIINYVIARKNSWAFLVGLAYITTTIIAWMLAGQDVQNFLIFIKTSFAFSAGYADGLAQHPGDSSPAIQFLPLLILALALTAKTLFHWKKNRHWRAVMRLLLLAGSELFLGFISYKHGIVSEDSYHMQVYFSYVIMSVIPYFYITPVTLRLEDDTSAIVNSQGSGGCQKAPGSWAREAEYIMEKCLLPKRILIPLVMISYFAIRSPNARKNMDFIVNFDDRMTQCDDQLQTSIKSMALPKIKDVVRDDSVTYFGELLGPMMYNGLNYKPTPTTISFVGWNKMLADKEASFFRNTDALPQYLILQFQNTDDIAKQFSPLDGVYAQLEIMRNYEPFLINKQPVVERNRILLRKTSLVQDVSFSEISEFSAKTGEWIDVKEPNGIPILASIEIESAPVDPLLHALYKPSAYYIEFVLDNDAVATARFTPSKGKDGFLISPLIWKNINFLAAISKDEWQNFKNGHSDKLHKITRYRIIGPHEALSCERNIIVKYKAVNGIPFGRYDMNLD